MLRTVVLLLSLMSLSVVLTSGPCTGKGVNGGWTTWGSWESCSVTCDAGLRIRSRTCTDPAPVGGGSDCTGVSSQSDSCNAGPCPINGGWTTWGSWGPCSVTCDSGLRTRSRTCTNPAPVGGGADCTGVSSQSDSCNAGPCPINGGWTTWGSWESCSVTCDAGLRTRPRTCTNPAPVGGGADCTGVSSQSDSCNAGTCPINGGWSEWGSWESCSVTCGAGLRTRSRTCTNPAPVGGGADCTGVSSQSDSCNAGTCPT